MRDTPIIWIAAEQLEHGLAASRRGRCPVLCWDRRDAWVVTHPRSTRAAASLLRTQKQRGIKALMFIPSDAQGELERRTTHRRTDDERYTTNG